MDEGNPHMNKPSELPGNSLQSSMRATPQEIMVEIARLEIHCPVFSPMSEEARREWIVTLCRDLAHKSLAELQFGAKRYRTTAGNRWFPNSGTWLEACKNPFADPPSRYAPLEELPPPIPPEKVTEVIRKAYEKHNYFPRNMDGSQSIESRKAEIAARPITPPEKNLTPERKAQLRALREAAERNLPGSVR